MPKNLKYFLESLIILPLYFIIYLTPVDLASSLGGFLFKFLGPLTQKHKIALRNLKNSFPNKSDDEIELIATNMWENLGRTFFEFPHTSKLIRDEKRFKIKDFDNFKELAEDGKAGFFISGHISNWEIASAVMLKIGIKNNRIYRTANNPLIEKFLLKNYRGGEYGELIPKGQGSSQKILSLIRKGEHICMLIDQKLNEGLDINFFGRPAKTAPAVARLSKKLEAPILMGRVIRTIGVNFIIEAPLLLKPSKEDTDEEILLKINRQLEHWITEYPEQWYWIHKRWHKEEYQDL
jgi:KDO2-lipid IV(A) lauroyltransferase